MLKNTTCIIRLSVISGELIVISGVCFITVRAVPYQQRRVKTKKHCYSIQEDVLVSTY